MTHEPVLRSSDKVARNYKALCPSPWILCERFSDKHPLTHTHQRAEFLEIDELVAISVYVGDHGFDLVGVQSEGIRRLADVSFQMRCRNVAVVIEIELKRGD